MSSARCAVVRSSTDAAARASSRDLDGRGTLTLEVEAEPGHAVGLGLEAHPPVERIARLTMFERLVQQALAQTAQAAPQRGIRHACCAIECRGLEFADEPLRHALRRIDDRARVGEADRTALERVERGRQRPKSLGVGDHRSRLSLMRTQSSRELGDERARRQLAIGSNCCPHAPVRPHVHVHVLAGRAGASSACAARIEPSSATIASSSASSAVSAATTGSADRHNRAPVAPVAPSEPSAPVAPSARSASSANPVMTPFDHDPPTSDSAMKSPINEQKPVENGPKYGPVEDESRDGSRSRRPVLSERYDDRPLVRRRDRYV